MKMGGGAGLRWRDVGDDGVEKRIGGSPREAGGVADVEGDLMGFVVVGKTKGRCVGVDGCGCGMNRERKRK